MSIVIGQFLWPFINTELSLVCQTNTDLWLVRYNVEVGGPRPESYWEDYSLGENSQLSDQEKDKWYQDMKSGAESGGLGLTVLWLVETNYTDLWLVETIIC